MFFIYDALLKFLAEIPDRFARNNFLGNCQSEHGAFPVLALKVNLAAHLAAK